MPIRGELPIRLTSADEMRRLSGTIGDEIASLAKDMDFLAVCLASAIGLAFSLAFVIAFASFAGS